MSYRTWNEIVRLALSETRETFSNQEVAPGKEEFVGTFRSFYDELTVESIVTSWPYDPAGSGRAAEGRARVVWADEYSEWAVC